MEDLGFLLLNHPDLVRQSDEGAFWVRRAAEAGTWQASNVLGVLAIDGRAGVPQDSAQAFFWFNVAVAQGGAETEPLIRDDLLRARDLLSAEQQAAQIQAAQEWLQRHTHHDLFVIDPGPRDLFPVQGCMPACPTAIRAISSVN